MTQTHLMELASMVRSGHASYDTLEKSALGVDDNQLDKWDEEFHSLSYSRLLAIVNNRETDSRVLGAMALGEINGEVVRAAVLNPSTCPGALVVMAYKPWDSCFKKEVASNPSTPSWTLTHLSQRGDARIVEAVAKNVSTPIDTLCRLVLDTRYRRAALSNLALPDWIVADFCKVSDSDRAFARSEIERKREIMHDLSFRASLAMVDMLHHS